MNVAKMSPPSALGDIPPSIHRRTVLLPVSPSGIQSSDRPYHLASPRRAFLPSPAHASQCLSITSPRARVQAHARSGPIRAQHLFALHPPSAMPCSAGEEQAGKRSELPVPRRVSSVRPVGRSGPAARGGVGMRAGGGRGAAVGAGAGTLAKQYSTK